MEHIDEALGVAVPIMVYWAYSGFYEVIGSIERFQKYKIHSLHDEKNKNLISKPKVAIAVLLQQLLQAAVALLSFTVAVAMVVVDTYMYFVHRLLHRNMFLYKHMHSYHHKIVAPYAFAAQYNHPVEGLLVDTAAGALGYVASGMSPRTAVLFFSLCSVKTVDDHCSMRMPWNVFHLLFWNNTAYHDVHHQLYGNKYNFSQPFFVAWDEIMGTSLPCSSSA